MSFTESYIEGSAFCSNMVRVRPLNGMGASLAETGRANCSGQINAVAARSDNYPPQYSGYYPLPFNNDCGLQL